MSYTDVILCVIIVDYPVQPLVMLVKKWANDASCGTLSSDGSSLFMYKVNLLYNVAQFLREICNIDHFANNKVNRYMFQVHLHEIEPVQ